jgi:peroxiredoxin
MAAAVLLAAGAAVAAISVGERIPTANLHLGFPPDFVDLSSRIAGKNVVLISLPGAFTPT